MRLNRNLIEHLACFKSNCVMFVSVCVVRNGGCFAHVFNKERTTEKEQLLTNIFDYFLFFALTRSVPQTYIVVIEVSVNSFNFYKM